MGKEGPCCHCGIAITPLWRKGPPEKSVLCNACGSRWRTKGTLANYTPIHCRGFLPLDSEDLRSKNSRFYKLEVQSIQKTYHQHVGVIQDEESTPEYGVCSADFEDATSKLSSSGSAISCVQLASMEGNDTSGCSQSSFWNFHVPSRKRTSRKYCSISLVKKLRSDLFQILKEEEPSYLSKCAENELFFQSKDPLPYAEIGLGCVLIKQPLSSAEEESIGSSVMAESKISCLNDTNLDPCVFHALPQYCESSSALGAKDAYESWESLNTLISYFDPKQSDCSSQVLNNYDPKVEKEVSCSSDIVEAENSVMTKLQAGSPNSGEICRTKCPSIVQWNVKMSGTQGNVKEQGSTSLGPHQMSSSTDSKVQRGAMDRVKTDQIVTTLFHSGARFPPQNPVETFDKDQMWSLNSDISFLPHISKDTTNMLEETQSALSLHKPISHYPSRHFSGQHSSGST